MHLNLNIIDVCKFKLLILSKKHKFYKLLFNK